MSKTEPLCRVCDLPTAWHGNGDNLTCPVGRHRVDTYTPTNKQISAFEQQIIEEER